MPADANVVEGKAQMLIPGGLSPNTQSVFYNPQMSLNRDMAVLFVSSFFPSGRQLRVCDLFTGSGVRAIRYVLECPNVSTVTAVDGDEDSIATALNNVRMNSLDERVNVVRAEVAEYLAGSTRNRFDVVDLDPYGSPAPFFESAVRATYDGGVLAATATDMGPLTGTKPRSCLRKYGTWPIRTEFPKEMALRTLAACLAREACKLRVGIRVVFGHASDHHARIYGTIEVNKTEANATADLLGFIQYCPNCLWRKKRSSLSDITERCELCGCRAGAAGPIWLGPLWDNRLVMLMVGNVPNVQSSRMSQLQRTISQIEGDAAGPAFHYTTDTLSRVLRIRPPGVQDTISALRESGYAATRTHLEPTGFRTDATVREIGALLNPLSVKA